MKIGGLINLLFIFVNAALAIKYQFPFVEWGLLFITVVVISQFFRRVDIKSNVFLLFLMFYITCSVHIVALFELRSIGFFKDVIYPGEYKSLALWGNHLFFIISVVSLILNKLYKNKGLNYYNTTLQLRGDNADKIFRNIAFFVYFLQFITITLGITDTTEGAKLVLPFHLNGIIDELRSQTFRFIFAIYLYHKYMRSEKIEKNCILYFVIYSLIEVFVRSSKGVFVENFLPAIVMIFFLGKLNKKIAVKVLLPLALSLAILYPVIEYARSEGDLSMESVTSSFKNRKNIDEEEKSSAYIRTFLTGVYYTKLIDVVSKDNIEFDFRQLPQVLILGGGSAYMTRVIDQMPEYAHHSSGITGLCDALLWGGHPMCYLYLIFLVLIAFWGDHSSLMNRKLLYRLILFFWFYERILGTAFSYFIDPLFFAGVGSIIIKITIAQIYYRYAGYKKIN